MPLRFFADHCIANAIIQELQNAGYEVLRLKDHLPIESSDSVVITTAQKLHSILLSLNGDFTDILKSSRTIAFTSDFRLQISDLNLNLTVPCVRKS